MNVVTKPAVLAIFVSVALTGCPEGANSNLRKVRMAKCKEATSFCRTFPANADGRDITRGWPLLAMQKNDLLSKPDADFLIYKDWNPHWTQPLKISKDDRIRIWEQSDGTIALEHHNKDGKLVAKVKSLKLKKTDGGNLWAIGDVYFESSLQANGKYIVYRTVDNEDCNNPDAFEDPCRQFHFEYFAKNAPTAEYPEFCVNIEAAADGSCDGPRESDEGDGDEGKLKKASH